MDFLAMILRIPGFLLAISVHEYAHARVAYSLGDDTAARAGRMTIEPWAHLDPIGALMLVIFQFGWARPVPVDPYRLKDPRKDMAKVALAGPVANLILAFILQVATVLLSVRFRFTGALSYLPLILHYGAWVNTGLAIFNLLPVPPLDGSRILATYIPHSFLGVWSTVERYGFIILLGLIYMGVVSTILGPLMSGYMSAVGSVGLGLARMLFGR